MTIARSIILVADDDAMKDAVVNAVDHVESLSLEVREGTLASINGSAVNLLNEHDLMVFRLLDRNDIDLVRSLRKQAGPSGKLLALSDENISLSDARALKKSGLDEILPFPISSDELSEQLDRLSTPSSMLPAIYTKSDPERNGQVIGICPVRGGAGSSTLAVNLADQLQGRSGIFRKHTRNRVAVVDLDMQFGTIATGLDLAPSNGIYKMARDGVIPDRTFLRQCLVSHSSGLDVLTAPDEFVPLEAFSREQITALVDALRQEFDYVVIDLPRVMIDWLGAIVSSCDRLLLVTDTAVPSIRQAHRLIQFFSQERLELPLEIIVSHETKPLFPAGHHSEAERVLGRKIRHWLPYDPRHAKMALDRGQLLSKAAKGSALSKAIRALSGKILAEKPDVAAAKNRNTV
ncbi:AAA family ATPase [Ruegeria marina]|uniref:AAA domain-containing protein n=1 Tax=Ruegeria marina TaxID=639004 RepID=A0A1G7FAX0_9RHOB|nr:AAA family ATPase [Ruegeria marina]SDE72665.1 AAA domain-containing protein [Ruegeria marina]